MVPSKLSVMPEKLLEKLGPENTRDLMLFLLSGPPHLVDYGRLKPPAPRPLKEVQAVLAGSEPPPASLRKVKVVLVAGRKDHGPGEHDYPAWKVMWQRLMSMAPETIVETADEWPSPGQLETADCLVFYQQGTWTSQRARDIDAYLARGGGLVYIHYAVDGGQDAPGFAQRIGLAWRGGASAFRHGELELGFEPGKNHPIARNLPSLKLHDESYWQLTGDSKAIRLIATGMENGQPQPLFWTLEPSNGRVFVSIPGHFSWSFDDPLFRVLLLRGIAWSTKESVDRFNELVLPGARVAD
jgi:type 1 glutamine amidotransferase